MPPIGVLMSTCFPWPLFSFLTFTLQEDRKNVVSERNAIPIDHNLVLRIACPSPGDLSGTVQSGTTLRYVGNRNRKAAADRNFSEECFDRCDLGDRRV